MVTRQAKYSTSEKGKLSHAKYSSTLRGRFVRSKANAKHRGICFLITYEEYVSLTKGTDVCEYCGRTVRECVGLNNFVKKYEGNDPAVLKVCINIKNNGYNSNNLHIDRKDSLLGYTLENCTLSCAICNYSKGWFLSHSVFKKVAKEAMDELINTCVSAGYEVENG